MKNFKVTLRGSIVLDDIEAEDEDDAYVKALEMAEHCMVHDIIDGGDVEEINEESKQEDKLNKIINDLYGEEMDNEWNSSLQR